jgi:hypothetical protein
MKIKGAFLFECTLKCLSDDFAYTVAAYPGWRDYDDDENYDDEDG